MMILMMSNNDLRLKFLILTFDVKFKFKFEENNTGSFISPGQFIPG